MHELPAGDVVEVNAAFLNSAHVELLDNARLVDQRPALFRYFEAAPSKIYAHFKARGE